MKRLLNKFETNDNYRMAFFIFIWIIFVIIGTLAFVEDNETAEAVIGILFILFGFNVGVYMYVEEKERKVRKKIERKR